MLIEHTPSVTDTARASSRRWAPTLALLALSLPTLLFVWINRDVPHFGVLQDDGMYLIDGKALAEGAGYRILSLPAQPYDTRYPPLYPLYLSLAWLAAPSYPATLAGAVMLSWLCLPMVLLLGYGWCRGAAVFRADYLVDPGPVRAQPLCAVFRVELGWK